ncbi:MAG: hypothetical protein SW833_07280 [Cyanobacteriota bacterium]|nr:hypothetical protein [Cyanobacteriota bacterium]
MNKCPCCDQSMLIFAGKNRLYWYCPSCRQEMPDLVNVMMAARQKVPQLPPVFELNESSEREKEVVGSA